MLKYCLIVWSSQSEHPIVMSASRSRTGATSGAPEEYTGKADGAHSKLGFKRVFSTWYPRKNVRYTITITERDRVGSAHVEENKTQHNKRSYRALPHSSVLLLSTTSVVIVPYRIPRCYCEGRSRRPRICPHRRIRG